MTLPDKLFCDTSFFYAGLDPADTNHTRAQALTAEAYDRAVDMFSTWDVISETVTLLRYRRGYDIAVMFLDVAKPNLRIVPYGDRVRSEAEQVFRQHGRNRRLSFCDAISFVVVTTLLDRMPCLAFDRDFQRLGLTVLA